MNRFFLFVLGFVGFISGCVSWTDAPRVATTCLPEDTWAVALSSLQEFELRRIDKPSGVIETDWIQVYNPSKSRSGVFQRELNEERARFVITVEPGKEGSIVSVKQVREFWSPQGVQSRSWRQIPPHEEQERQLAGRIQNRLKRKAC